ncbi:MAG: hypothetical protein IJN68_01035 [Clostridia bacterium]|nr:hypothetical protein [Clostridia bacterium]
MKVYTREQLIKRLKICGIIGIICVIPFIFLTIIPMFSEGSTTFGDILMIALYIAGAIILFPTSVMAMSFNFGNMLIGIIAPIPILSYFVEFFKAYYYVIKALIVILRQEEKLVIVLNKKSNKNGSEE